MREIDMLNVNGRLISFFEKKEGVVFFQDPYTGMKSFACKGFVISFDERYDDDLIEARCDQLRLFFFTETEEGCRLKEILSSHEFSDDEAVFEANKLVFSRIIDETQ